MARELAKCLPQPQRQEKGFIRTGGGIVTWAYGHMLQQAEPQDYNRQYKQWKDADLPIIPVQWKLLEQGAVRRHLPSHQRRRYYRPCRRP